MAKFYTGQGDDGSTGLLGEGRIPKYDLRMEAIGAVDEASAALGVARSQCSRSENQTRILRIQRELYRLMAELAATPQTAARFHTIDSNAVRRLEDEIGILEQSVSAPNEFILPGDSSAGAALDLARTIVRRAERRVTEILARGEITNADLGRYLNRLSSLVFLMELSENAASGRENPSLAKEK
ncbi:ATP:cob(I)alamin adenosyltransferase [Longilinea arvoryzae]|uniref:Corrinoid adenosyltransferase n=1 Tax=Longilinea arvoryzae TaxID=360412 RepID=A0A0S7BLQ5_9CHLR|nr:cob(I)yrinic acid a,c-diamide adenosyltransferase [Longilinea arvoryzae]GAP15122.1 ATP:cob(I)alamin adenosyltransferase [Longilinea arvoryzae]